MILRDYQQAGLQAIDDAYARGVRSMLAAMATGSGKTVMFADLVSRRPGRALILAHRDRLIQQAVSKLEDFIPRHKIGVVKAGQKQCAADVVVASVQTLARANNLAMMPRFDTVIVDECFPTGTLIDGTPIEQIKVGDLVTCYDHSAQQITRKRVVDTMRKPAHYLVKVQLSNGENLTCTWNHPVYVTSNGKTSYIAAALIRRGDYIWKAAHQAENLRSLRRGIPAQKLEPPNGAHLLEEMQGSQARSATQEGLDELHLVRRGSRMQRAASARLGPPRQGLLLRGTQKEIHQPQSESCFIGIQPQARFGADEEKQPDQEARSFGQNVGQTKRAYISLPWRQWSTDRTTEETRSSPRLADGGCNSNRAGQGAIPIITTQLQSGHREQGPETCDRSGRQQPPDPQMEIPGSPQDRNLECVRVDGVEILEPGSDGTYGGLCPDGYVYNLEVEEHHNYFANGTLVHNCHRSAAITYRRILEHVRHQDTLLLGVTATPSRADGIGLSAIYEEIVYEVGILQLIEEGYLAPLRGQKIYIAADFSGLQTKTNTDGINDYKQDEVVKLMNQADWYKHATDGWLKCAADRRTIAFVPPGKDDDGRSTAMAFQLADHMRERGISAVAVNGESDLSEQRRVIRDFEAGQIRVIVNVDLFTEGLDIPAINCIVYARPTKSLTVYCQAIGRGTRPSPKTGKTDCLVLDLVGASNKFDLCTLGSLFGIKKLKDGEDVREAVEREKKETEEVAKQQELLRVKGEIRAQEIDLFGGIKQLPLQQSQQQEKKKLFEWHIYPERKQSFLVSGGHEFQISKVGDLYTFADMSWSSRFEGQTGDYNEAKAACEAEAKRVLFGDRDAPWRSAPASEKQIALLTKFKIPIKPDITKGEATDLLDKKFAKKKKKEVVTI